MACVATMPRNSSSPASRHSSEECPQNQLAPHLEKRELEKGFDIFRRFRITAVQTTECPEAVGARADARIRSLHQVAQETAISGWNGQRRSAMGFELPVRSMAPSAHE
jgi:hypothetical protein